MGDFRGNIVALQHGHREMFRLIAPFALDREVHKALEQPLLSREGVVWFVAVEGRWPGHRNRAVGFCALRLEERDGTPEAWYDYAYVVPEYRDQGLYGRLYDVRQAFVDGLDPLPALARLVVREDRWPAYKERGFGEDRRRGKWVYASRALGKAVEVA